MSKTMTKSKSITPTTPGCWNLHNDHVETYSNTFDAFTKEECEKIITIGKNKGLISATLTSGNEHEIRESKVSWLYPDDIAWVYRRVTDIVLHANEKFFRFDIFGLNEGFQFTNYVAPGNKYGRHVDRGLNIAVRKLSLSIQLSDPEEYEGGDLCLHGGGSGMYMDKKQGTLIVFPSYTLHEVTPVTKGERNSLVTWVTGKPFK
jgi:PKHD-type hydroxylase